MKSKKATLLPLMVLVAIGASAGGARFPVVPAGAQDVADQDEIVKQIGPRKGVVVVADPESGGAGPAPSHSQGMALPAIQFEYDSARLTPIARDQVDQLGKALLQPASALVPVLVARPYRQYWRLSLQSRTCHTAGACGQAAPCAPPGGRGQPPDRGGIRGGLSNRRRSRGRRTEPQGGDRQPRAGARRGSGNRGRERP